MTQRVSATTHAEQLLWLAEQKTECLEGTVPQGTPNEIAMALALLKATIVNGKVHLRSCRCGGTGRLLRFPTLRQECSCTKVPAFLSKRMFHRDEGKECRGRGWVPVDDPKATLPCAHGWRFEQRDGGILAMCRLTPTSAGTLAHGPTHNEAAVSALYEAERRNLSASY